MNETRRKLLDATVETLREQGIAGVSARTIASAAGVNQALVFYHFGSVGGLLAQACTSGAAERAALYRERFAQATSLRELLVIGRELHEAEHSAGNVAVLAQALAGSQRDPELAAATTAALEVWVAELETVLDRVLADSPLAGVVDAPSLARIIASAFIGLELYDGADPEGARKALDALDGLGAILEMLDGLGPLATRMFRARTRHAASNQDSHSGTRGGSGRSKR
ncbi:TetR/AcrR family transcriptional regulator [Actinomadura nitritigenes]|uniref:TetR/AcrR family transcriptional regulator n=1 Tax=Actinomadura nitritigenes TaxID=134602 RepID=UPI003D8F7445